jgi:hypothetical protein
MSLDALSIEEKEVVRRAISAMPVVLTFEFESRMGITEDSASFLMETWPRVDDSDDNSEACLAINNALNDLLHGVGITDAQCQELTGVNREELWRIYRKWVTARGWENTGVR